MGLCENIVRFFKKKIGGNGFERCPKKKINCNTRQFGDGRQHTHKKHFFAEKQIINSLKIWWKFCLLQVSANFFYLISHVTYKELHCSKSKQRYFRC
jgi:hypothetical protein